MACVPAVGDASLSSSRCVLAERLGCYVSSVLAEKPGIEQSPNGVFTSTTRTVPIAVFRPPTKCSKPMPLHDPPHSRNCYAEERTKETAGSADSAGSSSSVSSSRNSSSSSSSSTNDMGGRDRFGPLPRGVYAGEYAKEETLFEPYKKEAQKVEFQKAERMMQMLRNTDLGRTEVLLAEEFVEDSEYAATGWSAVLLMLAPVSKDELCESHAVVLAVNIDKHYPDFLDLTHILMHAQLRGCPVHPYRRSTSRIRIVHIIRLKDRRGLE